jgi:hypothetical protein
MYYMPLIVNTFRYLKEKRIYCSPLRQRVS